MVHDVFSIVAPVVPENAGALRILLETRPHIPDEARQHYPGGFNLPLLITPATLPKLHFASMVVFDSQDLSDTSKSMAYLVFECCIDGPVDEFLDALLFLDRQQGGRLIRVFSHCCGFHPDASLKDYLLLHIHRPNLFHIGVPHMRRTHIGWGSDLRRELDTQLDAIVQQGQSADDPLRIVESLRAAVKVPAETADHLHFTRKGWIADPVNVWGSRIRYWSKLFAVAGLAIAVVLGVVAFAAYRWGLLGVIVVVIAAALIGKGLWRWLLGRDSRPITLDVDNLARLKEQEDHEVQNHMCTFTLIQDSVLRRVAARVILFTLNLFYRTFFTDITPGKLQGLPTIHFAHWTIVPVLDASGKPTGREVLMFLSNYDGSWEAYLDDFINFLLQGVEAIWANCVEFRSPLNAATFKAFARNGMSPWQCWYVAEPKTSVLNIHNDDQIRKGLLARTLTSDEARFWLSRFGTLKEGFETPPDDPGELQSWDVQGIVQSGYRQLRHSSFALLTITDVAKARTWLQSLTPHVTDAREIADKAQRQKHAINVAFTGHGLATLGLPASTLAAFSVPFQEGVAPKDREHRSRALGDVGSSAPSCWTWGGAGHQVDILLMLYAGCTKERIVLETRFVASFTQCGAVVGPIQGSFIQSQGKGPLKDLPAEHFGFVDGISQPEIEGTWRHRRSGRQPGADVIKAGEFVLGYRDEEGVLAPGIPVPAAHDPKYLLPVVDSSHDVHDFGRNGSYLVARQLRQHVTEFRQFVAKTASAHGVVTRDGESIASKIVGRRMDGTPLAPELPPDGNDFTFAHDDPNGFHCPVGAHIRRTNPRDSLGDDPVAALKSVRRRRLLRRGRTYGEPLPTGSMEHAEEPRGMMFICLNSDIERQFEFVQQNWIDSPVFGGLYAERDPMLGERHASESLLTLQANGVRTRLQGLDRFVTVEGAEYFFLPGLRALRYLSSLTTESVTASAPVHVTVPAPLQVTVPAPPRRQPLAGLLARVAGVLPTLSLLWAIRFPLLLAAALAALPLTTIGELKTIGVSFFITGKIGLTLVATLASLAASAVMITLRLVLLYGERVSLGRSRWNGPTRWAHVVAFQLLAIPVTAACIHWTAADRTWLVGHASNTRAYLLEWSELLPAAVAGIAIGLLLMDLATWIQALRIGAQPELMFPSNPLTELLGARSHRLRPHGLVSRVLTQGRHVLIDQVPRAIGVGYIDYRERRLLPGHAFGLALGAIVLAIYAVGYIALYPGWSSLAERIPSIAYLLLLLILVGSLLSAAAFFFDRYRLSSVAMLVVWLVIVASTWQTDHYFPVGEKLQKIPTPAQALASARMIHPALANRIVIVMSEGLGLESSAWTATVLTQLTEQLARVPFTESVVLLSGSSGASLGITYFVNEYTKDGFRRARLDDIRAHAFAPSSGQGGWGFIYPDFIRTFAPLVVPKYVDRGWAMEQSWKQRLGASEPSLGTWQQGVTEGWRPATAFGVTVVETGEHSLLATYQTGAREIAEGRDMSVFTAARLSATFPIISPPTRADLKAHDAHAPAYHVVDSGLTDNSGWTAVKRWLIAVDSDLEKTSVLLIDIRSIPPHSAKRPADKAWTYELTGQFQALINARTARHEEVSSEIADFNRWWATHHAPLEHVTFPLDDDTVPLSWNLGQADEIRLREAWLRNQSSVARVLTFLQEDANGQPN